MQEIIKSMGSLTLTKETPSTIASQLYANMTDNNTDPFKIFVRADCLLKTMEALKKLAKESTVEQIDQGEEDYLGVKLETAEFGTKYDYSKTPLWNELKAEEDAIATKRKNLESILKLTKEHTGQVDPDSGELTELFPPIKTSTTAPKLTYPK